MSAAPVIVPSARRRRRPDVRYYVRREGVGLAVYEGVARSTIIPAHRGETPGVDLVIAAHLLGLARVPATRCVQLAPRLARAELIRQALRDDGVTRSELKAWAEGQPC